VENAVEASSHVNRLSRQETWVTLKQYWVRWVLGSKWCENGLRRRRGLGSQRWI